MLVIMHDEKRDQRFLGSFTKSTSTLVSSVTNNDTIANPLD